MSSSRLLLHAWGGQMMRQNLPMEPDDKTQSLMTSLDSSVSISPTPPRAKHRKHGLPKFNVVMYDAEEAKYIKKTTDLEKLTDYTGYYVKIRKTQRRTHVIELSAFYQIVEDAFKEKKYTISSNKNHKISDSKVNSKQQRSGDFTIHNGQYRIEMLFDVSTGSNIEHVIRRASIDICGVRLCYGSPLAVMHNPKTLVLFDRAIAMHAGTHYPCIKSDCYCIFPKEYDYVDCFTCPVCSTKQCPKCQSSWEPHDGMTCGQYMLKNSLTRLTDPLMIEGLREGRMQPCPTCAAIVEKPDGCNRMTCTQCAKSWCWACGIGNMTSDAIYDHLSRKGCPVALGIFSEDAAGASAVTEAIKTRNKTTFGSKLDKLEGKEEKQVEEKEGKEDDESSEDESSEDEEDKKNKENKEDKEDNQIQRVIDANIKIENIAGLNRIREILGAKQRAYNRIIAGDDQNTNDDIFIPMELWFAPKNKYTPIYHYDPNRQPTDITLHEYTYSLYPATYQPTGHINVSRVMTFYKPDNYAWLSKLWITPTTDSKLFDYSHLLHLMPETRAIFDNYKEYLDYPTDPINYVTDYINATHRLGSLLIEKHKLNTRSMNTFAILYYWMVYIARRHIIPISVPKIIKMANEIIQVYELLRDISIKKEKRMIQIEEVVVEEVVVEKVEVKEVELPPANIINQQERPDNLNYIVDHIYQEDDDAAEAAHLQQLYDVEDLD